MIWTKIYAPDACENFLPFPYLPICVANNFLVVAEVFQGLKVQCKN